MARSKKEDEYSVKRNDILDSAQKLILTKGYEQMSIQDIMDDLRISKGAFYHYFRSKSDLLVGLSDKLVDASMLIIRPIVEDPSLTALAKFQTFVDTIARWKIAQKEYLMQLLKVWYADENAVLRQKLIISSKKAVAPLLNRIIDQGIREGVFQPKRNVLFGDIYLTLITDLGDSIALMMLDTSKTHPPGMIQQIVDSYTGVITDILGAPDGSITIFDPKLLEEWTINSSSQSYKSEEVLSTVLEE